MTNPKKANSDPFEGTESEQNLIEKIHSILYSEQDSNTFSVADDLFLFRYGKNLDSFSFWTDFAAIGSGKIYENTFRLDDPLLSSASFADVFHNTDYFEFMFVEKGTVRKQFDGYEVSVHAGDINITNRIISHKEELIGDAVSISVLGIRPEYFKKDGFDADCEKYGKQIGRLARFLQENYRDSQHQKKQELEYQLKKEQMRQIDSLPVKEYLDMIYREMTERRPGYPTMIRGLLIRLFACLDSPKYYTSKTVDLGAARIRGIVRSARNYIDNKKFRVTEEEVATYLGYHRNYLARIFKQTTGMTVHEYSKDSLMKEAAHLLTESDLSISEIIARLGFENRTHFYKIFTDHFGMSPAEYRNACR